MLIAAKIVRIDPGPAPGQWGAEPFQSVNRSSTIRCHL
jgi:hypothetical protein